MSAFKLLFVNVPHGKSELVSRAAVQAGSFGGTVAMGRGISPSALLSALGFGDSTRDILIILSTEREYIPICQSIETACRQEKKDFGHLLVLDADGMTKSSVPFNAGETGKSGTTGGADMEQKEEKAGQPSLSLITVVLNKGYADDAMAAARKAGAGGGTVINARGTAREDDAKFFGVHIVPEKEMLMIVVPQEKRDAVLEAVRTLPCLAEPGSGIAFSAPVENFTQLGK
ncbi:MAG: transcriptional regulator [Treponema sp.]|nr:transcriptional regulator [Treponema sp.]